MANPCSELAALPWHDETQQLFSLALEDLKNVRPHLHAAAEYYEVAFLQSPHKKAAMESLKAYSSMALVNAIDHIGTVAYHLNESLSKQTAEMDMLEIRASCLRQRLTACHESTAREGLRHSKQNRRRPAYCKRYECADTTIEEGPLSLLRLSPDKLAEVFEANVGADSNTLKSLSWYLAFESSYAATRKNVGHPKRSTSMELKRTGFSTPEQLSRSLSSGRTPICKHEPIAAVNEASSSNSKSLRSLMLSDAGEYKVESCRVRRNMLGSFLRKNGKFKSFDSCRR